MKFLTQAAKVRDEQKKGKRRLAVFLCLAVVVALGTAATLKMYGQAMSHKDKRLICQLEAHQHTDACYDGDKLICGYADYVVHTHNDDCYDGDGNLVCSLPEMAAHSHTDECYTEQEVLLCGEEEGHTHTEECYTSEKGELLCQLEEHTHGEECYDPETGELTCQVEEHQHHDSCYEWKEVLTCAYASEGHVHSEECYTPEKGELLCQIEEHTHGEECFDEANELICNLEEHTHSDDCYQWEDVLTCQLEETQPGHTHTDACYGKEKVLTCGQLELHTHDENCQDENGALVCGLLELKEHTHQEECFEVVELTDEEVAAKLEEGKPEDGAGTVSEDATDSVSEDAYEHEHDETCYDAAGGLMCGYEDVEEEPDIVKTYEDDAYIVTAKYSEKANIPEEAELKAELITAESGAEHYAKREAEIKEALEDDTVSMNALVKIGFYVDEEEVEPEDDVVITVQFLDEDGMKDGSPIAVVHFAEGGSEVISGGIAKDKSTTFKTGKFSEFGIVEGYEVESKAGTKDTKQISNSDAVSVSETCDYEDDIYHITFQLKGEITLSESEDDNDILESENGNEEFASGNNVSEDEASEDAVMPVGDEETIEGEESEESEEGEETSENEISESELENSEKGTDEAVENEEDASIDNSEQSTGKELKFEIHTLRNDSDEYAEAMDAYGEKAEEMLAIRAFQYSLTYGGENVDLSNCKVTAEVKPSDELSRRAKKSIPEVLSYLYSSDGKAVEDDNETEAQVEITAVSIPGEMSKGQITEKNSMLLNEESSDAVIVSAEADGTMVASARTKVDPSFTVEYYAYLDRVVQNPADVEEKNKLEVINTDKSSGGSLPTNTASVPTVKIAVDNDGRIMTNRQLTEVYRKKNCKYTEAPSISYFNALSNNPHYKLEEIWVKDSSRGTDQTNIGGSGVNISWRTVENQLWRVYSGTISNVHFTNFSDTAQKNLTYILIEDNPDNPQDKTCIRLIYEPETKEEDFSATIYDYDISDGWTTSGTGVNTIYRMDTTTHGINTQSNYEEGTTGAIYAFGNRNCGTDYGDTQAWSNNNHENKLNKGNPDVFKGCTFKLVTGVDGNNNVLFNKGIRQLNLFGTDQKKGKTIYGASNLAFSNKGDTYTLTKAEVAQEEGDTLSKAEQLDTFNNPTCGPIKYDGINAKVIWTNNFWPVDQVALNADKNDHKFGQANESGNADGKKKFKPYGTWNNLPVADDGIDHNCFFGMFYEVKFNLDESYCGPLEYYFFGDDDMWVFLDDQTLVCDIGGVHSSVGEYVNLWDYLKETDGKPKSGEHTLKFFYTERGASGSSCWMQFTLPSVTSMKNQSTGKLTNTLKVGKTVENADSDKQYEFRIHFTDQEGNNLLDQYSYSKYKKVQKTDSSGNLMLDSEGNPIYETEEVETDVIVYDGSTFYLGDKEYIIVNYLPDGAKYTITEASKSEDYDIITSVNGTAGDSGTVNGDIGDGKVNENKVEHTVEYVNEYKTYELPETGGPGNKMMYMAVLLLASTAALLKYKQLRYRREGRKR